MSKFEAIRKLRQRHDAVNESVARTMQDLNQKIESDESDPNNWYREKLYNVLQVQQKLLDNRMTSSIGSANEDILRQEMDRVEQLVTEIRSKSCLSWAVSHKKWVNT